MRVYKCDICDRVVAYSNVVRIKHGVNKSDICCGCWREFKRLRKKAREQEC